MAGDGRKKINYSIIPREDKTFEYPALDELVARHHVELAEAKIGLAWCFGFKPNADGQVVLGKCKKCGDLEREAHGFDFIIILNYEFWMHAETTKAQRLALLDHELCHAAVKMDEEGVAKMDTHNRPVWRIRRHDVEEFREIVERHGIWKQDLQAFAEAIRQAKQEPLLADPPPPVLRAVRNNYPKGGFDSWTISAPGEKAVTLTKETRQKINKKLAKLKTRAAG